MNNEFLMIMKPKGSIVVETAAPYRMSFLADDGVRDVTVGETFEALRVLRQNGYLGTLRLFAISIKKSVMSFFRSSQQQLLTAHKHTPEELSMFMRWEKEIEGLHDLPQ